jgi:hypothetical protein|uniref:hypothetical protein n=1 Tax=Altererythrobacter segetis TaxID=1104773 RepID=UPI001407F145|nr:hypothetical protein [Altererythrobacter segetis]
MQIDLLPLPRGPRRGATERLREELQALARGHAEFLSHSEKSWASVTFAGTRHRLDIAFAGEDAVEAAENFIAYLPEHEFTIPRQLVADAAVTAVDHRIGPAPRMEVRIELLLLDED